jgi:hypothetical protein
MSLLPLARHLPVLTRVHSAALVRSPIRAFSTPTHSAQSADQIRALVDKYLLKARRTSAGEEWKTVPLTNTQLLSEGVFLIMQPKICA